MTTSTFLVATRRFVDSVIYGVLNKSRASTKLRYYCASSLLATVQRIGEATSFPNEQPGQDYDFNWALNFDGVTPLKESAFRITKPLDLKLAGLNFMPCEKIPLKVDATASKALMLEAGSDDLSFETFDERFQRTKDLLSSSDRLYCPEGYVPGTRTTTRIISNSATLVPKLVAYLERAPRKNPTLQSITAYVLEGDTEDFAGYSIEEIVEEGMEAETSVAAVVVASEKPNIESVVAGLELSVTNLLKDDAARGEKINPGENI